MKIKLIGVYVNDQDKALKFYTDVIGFTKHADFSANGYRWLTVADPDGMELQLELNTNPAAQTYQQAMYAQNQRALMFYVDDVQAEYDRMTALGAKFTLPPTKVTGSTIATVDDGCGNLVQLTKLDAWAG
jgi:predicted enzyme related to lactoylglutathione lyase